MITNNKNSIEPDTGRKPDAPDKPRKIGQLLIMEGFLKREQLDTALDIQRKEHGCFGKPLGSILVTTGAITREELDAALRHPDLRKNIGAIAVEHKLLTKKDLKKCLKDKKPNQMLGTLLVENGFLTHDQIGELLQHQINSPKLGRLLIDLKQISEKDLQVAVKIQKSKRPLGEILCALNYITPQDLNMVLEKYDKQLGIENILLNLGYISRDTLLLVQEERDKTAQSIDKILMDKKIVSREQLQHALARKHNLPFRHLKAFAYTDKDKELLTAIIARSVAEEKLILPLSLNKNMLQVALSSTQQIKVLSTLKDHLKDYQISPVITTDEKFEELFEILYSRKLSAAAENMEEPSEDIDFMDIDLDENIEDSTSTPDCGSHDLEAEELVNFILKYGILNNASDIHIEQDREGPKLRYRIDGIIQDIDVPWLKHKLPDKIGSIISRIKLMSNLDVAERCLPQNGVFRINYYDKAKDEKFDLDFRIGTCRAIIGENVSIKIIDSRKSNIDLDQLGHSPRVLEPFKRTLTTSSGMVLVTGPTGCGKSSSLYGALRYLYNPGIKIITAEDPIEYSFPGITQTQTNVKINLTYQRLLRSFLRLDPDIILVGEIKDAETAAISFDAAQTGKLILSTMHTSDAVGAVTRLSDLSIESSLIASCLLSVVAQRLIRKICPFCKNEYIPDEDEWGTLFDSYPSELTFFRGDGCESCNFTGYKGRLLLSEIFVIDKEIGYSLSQGLSEADIRQMAIESGMKTMLDDGLLKLEETTLSEIIRAVPHDMIKTFQARNQAQQNADDLIEKLFDTTQTAKTLETAPESFRIKNPETESGAIEKMFNKYMAICELNNRNIDTDLKTFTSFIRESYHRIQDSTQCDRISFSIRNTNRSAEISAQPETQEKI